MLGDVSGKGLPAALYAVKLQGLFELLSEKQATPEIEAMLDHRVSLRLWVKVKKKWTRNEQILRELGLCKS